MIEPDVRLSSSDILRYLNVSGENLETTSRLARALFEDRNDPELQTFLREHGLRIAFHASDITKTHLQAIEKVHKAETLDLLRTDPFQCVGPIRGITYKRAAALWIRLGDQTDSSPLASAGIRDVINNARSRGDVWIERSATLHHAHAATSLPNIELEDALRRFVKSGVLTEIADGASKKLIRSQSLELEREIAARLNIRKNRDKAVDPFDVLYAMREAGIQDPHELQMNAVQCALEHQTTIITGGPGTGKSTILTAIRLMLERRQPGIRIRLVALAARVARSIGVRTGLTAETIHTTLGLGGGQGALYGAGNNLPADVVILEEAFMIGNRLFADLLEALAPNTRLIIVGDPEQLPPIAEGKPVEATLTTNTFPTVRLTMNHRSSSKDIPLAGQRMMKGLSFRPSDNVRRFATANYGDALIQIRQEFERLTNRGESVQILTAMHEGPLGTAFINQAVAGRKEIDVGDTVMQTVNDRDREILNGEIGTVVSHHGTSLMVERDDGTQIVYQKSEFHQLVHAWAITYHKSQGLEYDHVILVTSPSQRRMLSRNLINVGITRAKKSCLIIDHRDGLRVATAIETTNRRTTMLDRLILGENFR